MSIPPIIRNRLTQFDRGRRLVAFACGIAEAVLALGTGVFLVVVLEWGLRPGLTGRIWLSSGVYLLAGAWLALRAGGPLFRRWPLRQVARAYEDAAKGQFHERILSSVEMAESPPPGVSTWMVERTIQLASEEIGRVGSHGLVDRTPAGQAWKRAACVVLLVGLGCLIPRLGPRIRLAFYPLASTASLPGLRLVVTPGDCRVKQGTAIDLTVSAEGELETAKVIIIWSDGFQEAVLMSRTATNLSVLHLPAVSQGFRYSVVVGEARSPAFEVKVDVAPRIAKLQLVIQPPAYALQTNHVVEGGSATFLAGSRVRLQVETGAERLASAQWLPQRFVEEAVHADSDTTRVTNSEWLAEKAFKPDGIGWTLDLQPTNATEYQVRLVGNNGLKGEPSQKWTLQPLADEPPIARLEAPGTEPGLVGQDEVLRFLAAASDDVGLKRVELIVLNREALAGHKTLLPPPGQSGPTHGPAQREVKTALNYKLADLNALLGDELQFQLVATDLLDQSTRSEAVTVSIGALDKAIEAQLAERIKQLVSRVDAQLDYLRQTRTSWLSIGRNYREDDPNAQGPALTLLRSRLSEWSAEVDLVGGQLVSESETNSVPDVRFLYRLGSSVSAWSRQQRDVLLENCAQLSHPAGRNVLDTFNQGRELFSLALVDLEEFRRVLVVLDGALETEVLAARCENAQGRYKRGLPILFASPGAAPSPASTGAGLLAVFYEGIQLDGKILEQKIVNPRFDNYAPANRREQWSCRYQGDLNLPETGEWTLACVADDGVRLVIDGRSVLPPDAWSAHAATQYKVDLKLTNGWRPITLEFFQGASESKLQFLAAKKGQPLQEVPSAWLRPPSARRPEPVILPDDPALQKVVKDSLRDRVKSGLALPPSAPPMVCRFTNAVHNENLSRRVIEELPVSQRLSTNLASFATWKPEESQRAETEADRLTAFSKEAQRLLHEELEKYRWRYEGSLALKPIQNALQELRHINEELSQQPWNPSKRRTEPEQAKIDLAKTWERELERATTDATRQFFETARQKDATLGERALALQASSQAEEQLLPAEAKLIEALEEDVSKNDLVGKVSGRLEELDRKYRELNDLQERINREQVATEARRALPSARAFARAQAAADTAKLPEKYQEMKQATARVEQAQKVIGEYQEAGRLAHLAGESPQDAKGRETAQFVRELAGRTENNPPSLAKTIPPPLQKQTEVLARRPSAAPTAANLLAKPRLAMAIESSRLFRSGERKAAVAYELLGEDTGALLDTPERLQAATLRPLAERAAALAGEKGEEARQAEIQAADARFQQMASATPRDAAALAGTLDALSGLAKQAAGEAAKRQPLADQLGETATLAPPVADWTESSNPAEVAASAAKDSLDGIQGAPKEWDSYNDASQTLADAARQLRMDAALDQLANLDPYPAMPAADAPDLDPAAPSVSLADKVKMDGATGKAINQPAPKGIDQAEWARLNEQLRRGIRSSGVEHFSQEQQLAIRAYFEKLSSANVNPNL